MKSKKSLSKKSAISMVLNHLKKDSKEFKNQLKEDAILKKTLKKAK